MFHLLPNEVLEHLFSFLPVHHFPLRQVCILFRQVLVPVSPCDFRDQVFEAGEVDLLKLYNLPCSSCNFEMVLKRGHEELFRLVENSVQKGNCHSLSYACVQGGSKYITDRLLRKGYVTHSSLAYAACKQNRLELVKEMYNEEIELYSCVHEAVIGNALDILQWIVEKDPTYYNVILYTAIHLHREKVLCWLPRSHLRKVTRKDLFNRACLAPNMNMFKFLLEINYLPPQTLEISVELAKSPHVQMMKTLVTERGWTLDEDMFVAALQEGCHEMLSCLLELDCPRDDLNTLYFTSKESNIPWLIDNLPPTKEAMFDMCINFNTESVLFSLVTKGHLPESFKDDPEITYAALEAGFVRLAEEYKEKGCVFYDNVCLCVTNSASLEWLIENQVNLCPELYYRLVREMDLPLLKKLKRLVEFPANLLDYTFSLIRKCTNNALYSDRSLKLEEIAEWIKE